MLDEVPDEVRHKVSLYVNALLEKQQREKEEERQLLEDYTIDIPSEEE